MKRHVAVFAGLALLVVAAVALRFADLDTGPRIAILAALATAYVVATVVFFMQARALPGAVKTLLVVAFVLSVAFAGALAYDAHALVARGW